jgi:oxygen-independent coproporphyrinogen-3 oxidase
MDRIPRYTSYPTTPHFKPQLEHGAYTSWLEALAPEESLSLYLHIPYCRKLCWFCGCHTKVVNSDAPVKRYLELLKKEMQLLTPYLTANRVTHLHFGGGSPSLIDGDDFIDLMQAIRNCFTVTPEAEIAIELDPRTVETASVCAYREAGVTRASLGIQDFDPTVQRAINRWQPYDVVAGAIAALREQNIGAIHVDLVYGLPYQTEATVRHTLEQTLTLAPDRISTFGYAHVPHIKKRQTLIPEEALPKAEAREHLFEVATTLLRQAGYIPIGMDHFAKPEDPLAIAAQTRSLHRNFQGYTTDTARALIGLGVSSISSLPQGYAQNEPDVTAYAEQLSRHTLPIRRGLALTDSDKQRHRIIMSLMCQLSATVPEEILCAVQEKLTPHIEAGHIIQESPTSLKVTPLGKERLRLIAAAFDAYLPDATYQNALQGFYD